MIDPNQNPEPPQESEPIPIGKVLPEILRQMREGPVDDDPGRKLAARLRNAEQYARTIQVEIDTARREGRSADNLEALLRDANAQIHQVREGFMPGQDTRPQ